MTAGWIGRCWGCGAVVAGSVIEPDFGGEEEARDFVSDYKAERVEDISKVPLADCTCPKRRHGERDWVPTSSGSPSSPAPQEPTT